MTAEFLQVASARPASDRPGPFRAFADRLLGVAATATRGGAERRLAIGPLALTLRAADPALLAAFARGLADLPAAAPGPRAALTIHILAGPARLAGGEQPPPPAWPLPSGEHQHLRRLHLEPSLRLFSWHDGAVWQLHDPAAGAAVYWAREAAAIPEWDYGAPLRNLLAWALHDAGRVLLHGAVVGDARGALLVAGAGGAGKSSTTLAALRHAGLTTVGDDFVALAGDGFAEALFDTVKLDAAALRRLAVPAAWVANPGRPAGEKARLHLLRDLPGALVPRLAVRALAVPTLVARSASAAVAADRGVLLRALAPSSLFLVPGAERQRFAALAALTRRLPCLALELGSDPAGVAGLVGQVLRQVAP
jgi:hypothetical protein